MKDSRFFSGVFNLPPGISNGVSLPITLGAGMVLIIDPLVMCKAKPV